MRCNPERRKRRDFACLTVSYAQGMYYCNTHEEGQLEEDVEVFDLGSTRPPKMTAKEAEAYRGKNGQCQCTAGRTQPPGSLSLTLYCG